MVKQISKLGLIFFIAIMTFSFMTTPTTVRADNKVMIATDTNVSEQMKDVNSYFSLMNLSTLGEANGILDRLLELFGDLFRLISEFFSLISELISSISSN